MSAPIYSGTQDNTTPTTSKNNFWGYLAKPGQLFVPANKFVTTSAAATGTTLVRSAKGILAWHLAASGTYQLLADLGLILSQYVLPNINPGSTLSGAQSNTGQTVGIALQKVQALYKIGTANLTSGTIGITQSVYPADNAATAPIVTDILAATTLTLVQRANIYNTPYTPTNVSMLATASSAIMAELNAVTPATSTLDFYGLLLSVNYNY